MNLTILKQIFQMRRVPIATLALLFVTAVGLQLFLVFYQEPKVDSSRSLWLKERAEQSAGSGSQDKGRIYNKALSDLNTFRERIYPKSHFARFIAEIYGIALKNSLEVSSITYKPTLNKDEKLFLYGLTLSVGGDYIQLKRFINDLSRSTNPVVIDTVSLANQNATSGTVQLQVQISTFFKMEAQ